MSLQLTSCCVALMVLVILRPMSLSLDLIDLELIALDVSNLIVAGPMLVDLIPVSSWWHPAAIRVLMQPLWRPRGRRATLKVAHLLSIGPPINRNEVGVGHRWRLAPRGGSR